SAARRGGGAGASAISTGAARGGADAGTATGRRQWGQATVAPAVASGASSTCRQPAPTVEKGIPHLAGGGRKGSALGHCCIGPRLRLPARPRAANIHRAGRVLHSIASEGRLVLLALTLTQPPATDLGYLLGKAPGRAQTFPLAFGKAHVFYPEA